MNKKILFFLFLILTIFPSASFAQVVINEFSSETSQDWVELYNTSTSSADLSVYRLRDSTSSNKKDLSGTLESGKFISFSFGNDLNKNGDRVKLIKIENGQETLLEEIKYGDEGGICFAQENQSIGKLPDGSGSIVRFNASTKDASNTNNTAECVTPSPTSYPSAASSPSHKPSVSATPLPTKLLTPSKKPISKTSSTPNPTEIVIPKETLMPSAIAKAEVLGASSSAIAQFPVGLIFIGAGVVFSGAAGLLAFKKQNQV